MMSLRTRMTPSLPADTAKHSPHHASWQYANAHAPELSIFPAPFGPPDPPLPVFDIACAFSDPELPPDGPSCFLSPELLEAWSSNPLMSCVCVCACCWEEGEPGE